MDWGKETDWVISMIIAANQGAIPLWLVRFFSSFIFLCWWHGNLIEQIASFKYLSTILFYIYTDFVRSTHPNVKIFKYADDVSIVGLF